MILRSAVNPPKKFSPFINKVKVKAGDIFHIPAGTIHAIGKGVRLFEIQQSSDITYRVWDWNRPDHTSPDQDHPIARPLHKDRAMAVLNFSHQTPSSFRRQEISIPPALSGGGNRRKIIDSIRLLSIE